MDSEQTHLALVREYLAALAAGTSGHELARFFTPDAVQIELPNRLNPNGGTSDLAKLLERPEKAKHVVANQRYEIVWELAKGNRVAVEAVWTAEVLVPLGSLPVGGKMKAYFGMFFDFKEGRIASQRNYDCFEAF